MHYKTVFIAFGMWDLYFELRSGCVLVHKGVHVFSLVGNSVYVPGYIDTCMKNALRNKSLRVDNVGSLDVFKASWYFNPGNYSQLTNIGMVVRCHKMLCGSGSIFCS